MPKQTVDFVTEEGVALTLVAIRQVAQDLAAERVRQESIEAGEPLEVPTYTVKTLGGEEVVFEHVAPGPDEPGTLDVAGDAAETAYRHALWSRYRNALMRLAAKQAEARFEVMLFLGVEVEMPADDSWLDAQVEAGMGDIDRNSVKDKKIRYLTSEVLTTRDLTNVVTTLQMMMAGTAVSEGEISQFEGMFRRSMERQDARLVESALRQLRLLVGAPTPERVDGGDGVGDNETEVLGQDTE